MAQGDDMTKNFENRVKNEGIVDTRLYRYILRDTFCKTEIQRLPIKFLDTTAALHNWETVKVYK